MRAGFVLRVRLLTVGIVIFALILIARLYVVQIVYGEEFSARADRQYVRGSAPLYERGSILFESKDSGSLSAATLKSGFTLAINPRAIISPEDTYISLSAILPQIDKEVFLARASKYDDPYEEIAVKINEATADRIEKLALPGVELLRERWRYYPGNMLAAHAIGFVAYDGDVLRGQYGLERYYEDVLTREGESLYVNFFAEIFSNLSDSLFKDVPEGGDVVTSIEPSVQSYLEKKLEEIKQEWGSSRVGGIIIDPTDGSIYALAVSASFNLNEFGSVDDPSVFSNPLVENVYEMGSIIKPLTMAAGIDASAVTPATTYYDAGFLERDGYRISNFDGKGRGTVSMQEVLNQSLNTGAAYVAEKMGHEVFTKYMLSYGLGEETGIDLPGEVPGLVRNLQSTRAVEYVTASFGQGIAMTPIATVRALSTLANDGKLTTPHLAQTLVFRSGLTKKVSFPEGEQILKPESAEVVTRMLVEVVDEALLGGKVMLPHYSIAAKTGTAQIAKEGERGYYDDKFLHSFFGYFPAYEPRFLIFLYTLEPKARYASETLTHPFMDIVKFHINYYEIPPDR